MPEQLSLYIARRNVNWYTFYERQSTSFFKIKKFDPEILLPGIYSQTGIYIVYI